MADALTSSWAWLGPLALGLVMSGGCGGPATEAPAQRPDEAEINGAWGLTVDAHRATGKRYGRPANGFELVLLPDRTARWTDVPGVVWTPGSSVLERVEGSGSWELVEREAGYGVALTDGDGVRLALVEGAAPPWTLSLPELDRPERRLELTPIPTETP